MSETNEHAALLAKGADILADEGFDDEALACLTAAAEIERLAARVRELELEIQGNLDVRGLD